MLKEQELKEYNLTKRNGTWELVKLPKERESYVANQSTKQSIMDRHKARLVAKGFAQNEGELILKKPLLLRQR